jgi:hypothetical protein
VQAVAEPKEETAKADEFEVPATPHMRCRITNIHNFYTLMHTLANHILVAANILFDSTGMYLANVDSSKTVLVDWRVSIDAMLGGRYSCNHVYKVKVDMEAMLNNVKKAKKMSVMELALDGTMPERMKLSFFSNELKSVVWMQLMTDDDEDDMFQIPPVEYHHSIVMRSSTFKDAINTIANGCDHVKFIYTADGATNKQDFAIQYSSGMSDTVMNFPTVCVVSGNQQQQQQQQSVRLESSFRLKRLEQFVRITNATEYVKIFPADDNANTPMRITYDVAALGELSFYIAPVMPDDEGNIK